MRKKVYLAGGIGNLSFAEANGWRAYVKDVLPRDVYACFNPIDVLAIDFDDDGTVRMHMPDYEDEESMRQFDLYMLRKSDVVLVNFNDPDSIGTAQELALANEWRIPIVGVTEEIEMIHPWLRNCCNAIVPTLNEAVVWLDEFIGCADY